MVLLPPKFANLLESQYFEEVTDFLWTYRWIYDFKMTNIFVDDIISKMPSEWAEALLQLSTEELNSLPSGYIKLEWPKSLRKFLESCSHLVLSQEDLHIVPVLPNPIIRSCISRGMTPRKLHEVMNLARVVHEESRKAQCSYVLDVGSGLGYLDQVLHHNYGYYTKGLESKSDRTEKAHQRLSQGFCVHGVQHHVFQLDDSAYCVKTVNKLIEKMVRQQHVCDCGNGVSTFKTEERMECGNVITPETHKPTNFRIKESGGEIGESKVWLKPFPNVCMVGLHACGDLTPVMLKLFTHCPQIKLLIVVSCCYHRMHYVDQEQMEVYNNFPLSTELQKHLQGEKKKCFRHYLFRLGAQETTARWTQSKEEHEQHQKNVAYRGLLQLLAYHEGQEVQKQRRRGVKMRVIKTFKEYMDAAVVQYKMKEPVKKCKGKLLELYEEHKRKFPLIEVLTALQVMLQGVIEHLITIDRALFLMEQGHSCRIQKVFQDDISPRNLALIVHRGSQKQ